MSQVKLLRLVPAPSRPVALFEHWGARYGFALAAILVTAALRPAMGQVLSHNEAPFLLLFIAVGSAAIIGGAGPGFVATVLAAAGEHWFGGTPISLSQESFRIMIEGGIMLSLVGGQVHQARRRARASDAATLELERKVLEISDEERRRIGHDLHDGLGQHLTGISFLTASIAQRIAAGNCPSAEEAEKVTQLVSQAIGWTRDLARGLSPVTLETAGFVAAMEELTDNAASLFRINVAWNYDGPEIEMDRHKALHLFRIAQEAISNSVKHGKARRIDVDLVVRGDELQVRVTDDGCGLSAKTRANPGLGLQIMKYRARMVGAVLSVGCPDGNDRGTVIECACSISGPALGFANHPAGLRTLTDAPPQPA